MPPEAVVGVCCTDRAMRRTARSLLNRRMRRTARALLNRLRGGEPDSVEALRRTWSHYAQVWDRRPDLNLGMETLGEEWGGPAFAERIVADLTAPYLGADIDVLMMTRTRRFRLREPVGDIPDCGNRPPIRSWDP